MTYDENGPEGLDGREPEAPELTGALREAARAYNAPPPVTPREAMWERIAAARGDAGRPRASVIPITGRPPRLDAARLDNRRRPAWALPLAAALLLAAGIGVGRISTTWTAATSAPRTAPAGGAPQVAAEGSSAGASAPSDPLRTPTSVAQAPAAPSATTGGGAASDASASAPLAYRLAAAEHLATTETLLATLSADARAGRADTSVAAWARDLLGTTRVLLDSPAARDPKLARLLEDLELVLAQVAQLPPTPRSAEEIQAIDRAVRRHDVMTRVRAAIPEGPLPAGT